MGGVGLVGGGAGAAGGGGWGGSGRGDGRRRGVRTSEACVPELPSLQAVPLAAFGFEQTPVDVLQVPATWHWSEAVQRTGLQPVQVADWQMSVCVHALPSLQAVPLAAFGFEQTPVDVL